MKNLLSSGRQPVRRFESLIFNGESSVKTAISLSKVAIVKFGWRSTCTTFLLNVSVSFLILRLCSPITTDISFSLSLYLHKKNKLILSYVNLINYDNNLIIIIILPIIFAYYNNHYYYCNAYDVIGR